MLCHRRFFRWHVGPPRATAGDPEFTLKRTNKLSNIEFYVGALTASDSRVEKGGDSRGSLDVRCHRRM